MLRNANMSGVKNTKDVIKSSEKDEQGTEARIDGFQVRLFDGKQSAVGAESTISTRLGRTYSC